MCAARLARGLARAALLLAPACGGGAGAAGSASDMPPGDAPPGMVWVPGGEFRMGSATGPPDERPEHRVRLHGFWMDAREVTNAEFRTFVAATGHVTTAERAPTNAELGLPPDAPVPPEGRLPGSLVLSPPPPGEEISSPYDWWRWQTGADWRHPEGPSSNLAGRDAHPVVHVSYDDAVAYAAWAGKRLPTEAEWERGARGGEDGRAFVWGEEEAPGGRPPANIWQGDFPRINDGTDGFAGTAPVGSFPPNAYGLYDMAGNVWEWCSDWYRPDTYGLRAGGAVLDPPGPTSSLDPDEPGVKKRVTRGGSFLCSNCYCTGYRPSARMKTSPDTSLVHTGFRCVRDAAPSEGAAR